MSDKENEAEETAATTTPPTAAAIPDLIIPHASAQAILNYLATQPYQQVFQLIEGMRNLKSVTTLKAKPRGGPRKRGTRKRR